MPQAKKPNPQDRTGQVRQQQLADQKEKEEREEAELAAMMAAEEAENDKTVNLTDIEFADEDTPDEDEPTPEVTEVGGIVDLGDVEVQQATRVIRVNATIDPTIGAGNEFHFEEGRKYRVPAFVADHLEEKGYVWH